MPQGEKEARTEVELLHRQRGALAEFGHHALTIDDLDALLHEATELVSEVIDVKLVKVLELLPDGQTMLLRAGVGWKPGVVGHTTFDADSGSPSGYALKTDEPVISPEVAQERRFRIPDVLREHGVRSMVNVVIRGKGPAWGVLEVDSPAGRQFGQHDIDFLKTYANLLAAAIERLETHGKLEEAARRSDLLLGELRHRVRNLIANIQGIAHRTRATSASLDDFVAAFDDRLSALARTQDLLTRKAGEAVDLRALIETELEAHGALGRAGVTLEGPPVLLPPDLAQALAMGFHELATNAGKHGALRHDNSRLHVSWQRDESDACGAVRLVWRESGVPIEREPDRRGFGTEVFERALPHMIGGSCDKTFRADGVTCTIEFPAPEPAAYSLISSRVDSES